MVVSTTQHRPTFCSPSINISITVKESRIRCLTTLHEPTILYILFNKDLFSTINKPIMKYPVKYSTLHCLHVASWSIVINCGKMIMKKKNQLLQ